MRPSAQSGDVEKALFPADHDMRLLEERVGHIVEMPAAHCVVADIAV